MKTPGISVTILKDRGDWRTLALILFVYAFSLAIIFAPVLLPLWISILALAPLMALHSSLQHECIHNHPFKWQWLNDAIISLPLSPFVPYFRYKETHLGHHLDANLCDPYDDPESWYQTPWEWAERSRFSKAFFRFNNTLLGRMMFGPVIGMAGFIHWDLRQIVKGRLDVLASWMLHFGLLFVVLEIMLHYTRFPLWAFLLSGYLAMSIVMIRSFAEHMAHELSRGRSAIVEDRGLFSLLFLNNNFHAVHHSYPTVAWYKIPRLYRSRKNRFLEMNMNYRFSGYGDVFRRYFLRQKEPVDLPVHIQKMNPVSLCDEAVHISGESFPLAGEAVPVPGEAESVSARPVHNVRNSQF